MRIGTFSLNNRGGGAPLGAILHLTMAVKDLRRKGVTVRRLGCDCTFVVRYPPFLGGAPQVGTYTQRVYDQGAQAVVRAHAKRGPPYRVRFQYARSLVALSRQLRRCGGDRVTFALEPGGARTIGDAWTLAGALALVERSCVRGEPMGLWAPILAFLLRRAPANALRLRCSRLLCLTHAGRFRVRGCARRTTGAAEAAGARARV